MVSSWVSNVLLSSSKPLLSDDKIAFLEVEKLQLMSYIENKEFSNFKKLFNAVACNDNKKLKKLQCKILAESLIEKREELTNDTTYNKELDQLLSKIFLELEQGYKDEMLSKVNEALLFSLYYFVLLYAPPLLFWHSCCPIVPPLLIVLLYHYSLELYN